MTRLKAARAGDIPARTGARDGSRLLGACLRRIRRLGVSRLDATYMAAVAGMSALAAWNVGRNALAWARHAGDAPYVDFNALFLAGRLAAQGRLAEAYSWSAMQALERADASGEARFMPFSYPPPFALEMAGLSGLPDWAAYLAFDALGLALFASVLRRVAACRLWAVAAALCPAIYLNLAAGQNGLILGGVVGASALLSLRGRVAAGGGLAGLVAATKPQVALAMPLLFALCRDVRALVAVTCAAAALVGVSVAVLGPGVFADFLAGMGETSRGLASGHYPLYRMTSVFACLRSLGWPAQVALAAHAAVALGTVGLVAATARRGEDRHAVAGLALVATAFVSPYFYDYDGTIPGLGFALLAPALARSGEGWRAALPLFALSLATTVGVLQIDQPSPVSLGAPLLLLGFGSAALTLAGDRRAAVPAPA